LSDEITLQDLLEVQEHFGLPSAALVEKDFRVVQALAAIIAIDAAPCRLVFGGGTSLSRAHRIIRRMSEDIDLRIVSDREPTRPTLRRLRETTTKELLAAGFRFDPNNSAHRESRNQSRYTIYRLPYDPLLRGEGALRPEIQIEVSVWPLRMQAINLPVSSFVAEAFQRPPEIANIACVSIVETAADKFVALTRRVGAEIANADRARDDTLVRHIYDLHMARDRYDPVEVASLLHAIMLADAEAYGNQFPAYRDNPLAETLRAVDDLQNDPTFGQQYEEFQRNMVYGDQVDYSACMATLRDLARRLPLGKSFDR
jgi:predicted nucleotidyltransferase component of viral defense system